MPWSWRRFKEKHNRSLTPAEAKKAAAVANDVLRRTGDDKQAVIAGNSAVMNRRSAKLG